MGCCLAKEENVIIFVQFWKFNEICFKINLSSKKTGRNEKLEQHLKKTAVDSSGRISNDQVCKN